MKAFKLLSLGSQRVSSKLYKSLVRHILDYTAPVWSPPYLIKDIVSIEKGSRKGFTVEAETQRHDLRRSLSVTKLRADSERNEVNF